MNLRPIADNALPLYYKFVDQDVPYSIYSSIIQRRHYQIVPLSKHAFDLFSLISFLDATAVSYYSIGLNQVKRKIQNVEISYVIYGYLIGVTSNPSTKNYSILIEMSADFQYINIYLKDNIKFIKKTSQNGIYCLQFQSFFINDVNRTYTPEIFDFESHQSLKQSPLYIFGNYIAHSSVNMPTILKLLFSKFQTGRTLIRKNKVGETDDLIKMSCHLPGFVLLFTQKETANGFNYNSKFGRRCLQSLIWIFPWALSSIGNIQYQQIDGSFRHVKPYKYCLFHLFNKKPN